MPNWCCGDLKVRGKKSDLLNFLRNGLELSGFFSGNSESAFEVEEDKYGDITLSADEKWWSYWIKGTRRNFIEGVNKEIAVRGEGANCVMLLTGFQAAWGIEAASLAEISKQFNIDFRIYAFEKGMEFNQEIEVIKGEITLNREIGFSNYLWECPCPDIGG